MNTNRIFGFLVSLVLFTLCGLTFAGCGDDDEGAGSAPFTISGKELYPRSSGIDMGSNLCYAMLYAADSYWDGYSIEFYISSDEALKAGQQVNLRVEDLHELMEIQMVIYEYKVVSGTVTVASVSDANIVLRFDNVRLERTVGVSLCENPSDKPSYFTLNGKLTLEVE